MQRLSPKQRRSYIEFGYILPFLLHDASTRDGVRNASMRHDALARRKYVKPFKWFKFNRARKATAK